MTATLKASRSEIPPCFLSTRAYLASLPPGALPDRCPACGSREVCPVFWPDASLDQWDCADCKAMWGVRS